MLYHVEHLVAGREGEARAEKEELRGERRDDGGGDDSGAINSDAREEPGESEHVNNAKSISIKQTKRRVTIKSGSP